MTLSRRGQAWRTTVYPLSKGYLRYMDDPYSTDHPEGVIDLGTAQNSLVHELLTKKMNSIPHQLNLTDISYGPMTGYLRLKQAIAQLMKRIGLQLTPKNISIHNGCGSVVEMLSFALADPGDAFMIPAPFYGGFDMDIMRRPAVHIVCAHLSPQNQFKMDIKILEKTYQDALKSGIQVKALLAMNPVNPLGTLYSEEELLIMAEFCHKHDIHLILDEIYAFSVFEGTFKSIYTLPQLPNPQKVHLCWGFSKDFCLNGFRAGVFISMNPTLMNAANDQAYFTCVASPTQHLMASLLEDELWLNEFLNENQTRLGAAYTTISQFLTHWNQELIHEHSDILMKTKKSHFIHFLAAKAGFFIWCDFSVFLGPDPTVEKEDALWEQMIVKGKVYCAFGQAFHSQNPGWFRLVYSQESHVLQLALNRLKNCMNEFLLEQWVVCA